MDILKKKLDFYAKKISKSYNLSDKYLDNLYSVFPFNKFEYVISHLLATKIISLDDYFDIRNEYLARNKYLHLFEISAPRGFGETWAQNHLNELVQDLKRPNKKLDKNYSGEYDFWYEGIKIEVKASRAVDSYSDESLYIKALDSKSKLPFDMNFQQLKPGCCDVFIWVAVWRDKIRYWILPSKDALKSKFFSNQHRGSKGSKIIEGQIHITNDNISEFNKYEVSAKDILAKIIETKIKKASKK
ncbi:MAG: hypothetical protein FWF67_06965 [Fibromonadales bacterium]|nr:hypothetical protein [Fibromonadales bacterium]